MALPELMPGRALPLIEAAGYMLYRVSTSGPLTSRTSATAPMGTIVPLGVADPQPADILDLVAVFGLGLRDDLPGAAEEVEVVDVQRAQVDLERLEDVLELDPLEHQGRPVDVKVDLGDVGPEDRGAADQLRLLVGQLDEVLGLRLEGLRAQVAPVLDHDHVAAGPAHAPHRRRAEDHDGRFGDLRAEPRPQLVGDRLVIEVVASSACRSP